MDSARFSAFIFDDEPNARTLIKILLDDFFPEIDVLGESDSLKNSISQLEEIQPDIVFLDIQMNTSNGFDLFKIEYENIILNSKVIFVSAFERELKRVFNETTAVGFVLKPIDQSEFVVVVKKAITQLLQQKNIKTSKRESSASAILIDNKYLAEKILTIYAKEKSVFFLFKDGKTRAAADTILQNYENEKSGFFRVNRATLVNIKWVKKVSDIDENGEKQRGGIVIMENNVVESLSVRNKADFIKAFEAI